LRARRKIVTLWYKLKVIFSSSFRRGQIAEEKTCAMAGIPPSLEWCNRLLFIYSINDKWEKLSNLIHRCKLKTKEEKEQKTLKVDGSNWEKIIFGKTKVLDEQEKLKVLKSMFHQVSDSDPRNLDPYLEASNSEELIKKIWSENNDPVV
jgi:hypothetical protein